MISHQMPSALQGLHVVFWGSAPLDNPTAEFQWRYVACENGGLGLKIYRQMRAKLKPGWKLYMIDTSDIDAPLLPHAVELGIFKQRGYKTARCRVCGK